MGDIMNYKNTILALLIMVGLVLVLGCIDETDQKAQTLNNDPTVVLENSLERQLINRWLQEVGNPNNVMWLYHLTDTGQLIAKYPVVGKPVSMTKSNEPYERIEPNGNNWQYVKPAQNLIGYREGTSQLSNPSGTYGHDLPGVFFFTPDGAYHEIHGGIIITSSVPISIPDPIFNTYSINEEDAKMEQAYEDQLNESPLFK